MPKRFDLPKGFNTPDLYRLGGQALADALDPGYCEHCGSEIDGKQRYYSRRHHKVELCSKCAYRKSRGKLGPKEDIEGQAIQEEYGGDPGPLPF